MFQKAIPCRRDTSSLVSDSSNVNIVQVSPRTSSYHAEQRNPFALSSHASNTNFIGDSGAPLSAGPRTIAVTGTGEKLQLNDNDEIVRPTVTHQFSGATLPKIIEQSSSKSLISGDDKSNKNQCDSGESSGKLAKKSKNARHNVCPKHRLIFTPRNIEKSSSTRLPEELNLPEYKLLSSPSRKNTSSETQTDCFSNLPSSSCVLRKYDTTTKTIQSTGPLSIKTSKNTSSALKSNKLTGKSPQNWAQRQYKSLDQPSSLKLYTESNENSKNYSEFYRIVSSLTLMTVIWWLLSTFFDFNNVSEHIQNWYSTKEKPKTKTELLVKFLQDLWT